MKDFNGTDLAIGDTVAFLEPSYRHMTKGTVMGFSPKMIRITYQRMGWHDGQRQMHDVDVVRDPSYVAKIAQS